MAIVIQHTSPPEGRPRLWKSPQELEAKVEAYKSHCKDNNQLFSISGLAVALGCSRRTLVNYSRNKEFFPTIKRARAYGEVGLEHLLMTQKEVRGVIFALKNNYDWKDKVETEDTRGFSISDVIDQLPQTKHYLEFEGEGGQFEIN